MISSRDLNLYTNSNSISLYLNLRFVFIFVLPTIITLALDSFTISFHVPQYVGFPHYQQLEWCHLNTLAPTILYSIKSFNIIIIIATPLANKCSSMSLTNNVNSRCHKCSLSDTFISYQHV